MYPLLVARAEAVECELAFVVDPDLQRGIGIVVARAVGHPVATSGLCQLLPWPDRIYEVTNRRPGGHCLALARELR